VPAELLPVLPAPPPPPGRRDIPSPLCRALLAAKAAAVAVVRASLPGAACCLGSPDRPLPLPRPLPRPAAISILSALLPGWSYGLSDGVQPTQAPTNISCLNSLPPAQLTPIQQELQRDRHVCARTRSHITGVSKVITLSLRSAWLSDPCVQVLLQDSTDKTTRQASNLLHHCYQHMQ
jgi:hypothetical protein